MVFNSHIKKLIEDERILITSINHCSNTSFSIFEVSIADLGQKQNVYNADLIIVYDLSKEHFVILKNRYGKDGSIHPISSLIETIQYFFPNKFLNFEIYYDKEII
jgi:hypothetical protein